METGTGSSAISTRARWWMATWARAIEDVLPISAERRERWRERQVVRRWLINAILLSLVLWLLAAMTLVYNYGFEDVPDRVGGSIVNRPSAIRSARVGDLAFASNGSADMMHGPLAARSDGGQWGYEHLLKFSLDRPVDDHRSRQCKAIDYSKDRLPKTSVIFIFCNEPFETLMRSVHSVLNRSPPNLLEEIILVDDGSSADHIKPLDQGGSGLMEEHLKRLPPKVRLLRTGRRSGIVNARLTGIRAAKGEAFVILDSHVEAQPGWLEALVMPIGADRTSVVMPQIDGIDKFSYQPHRGGVGCTLGIIWKVMEHAFTPDSYSPQDRRDAKPWDYVTSPTMAGGLFAANRDFFLEIGGYDEAMTGWGAENVELSFRLWQCGGRLLCTECSRVYHMFGGGKHYTVTGHSTTSNRMRTMAAWMDEYADLAWRVLGKPSHSEIGDITPMLERREQLKCKDFQWFLDNVWPESEVRNLTQDVPYMGPLRSAFGNYCMAPIHRGTKRFALGGCMMPGRFIYWRRERRITAETNDETCLLTNGQADWCHHPQLQQWRIEDKSNTSSDLKVRVEKAARKLFDRPDDTALVRLIDPNSEKCLTASEADHGKVRVQLATCNNLKEDPKQLWLWSRYRPDPYWTELHGKVAEMDDD